LAPTRFQVTAQRPGRRIFLGGAAVALASLLAACSSNISLFDSTPTSPQQKPPSAATEIGTGQVKAALILPLTGSGNAGLVALSMRNAAELALAEFSAPNVQLIVKDDGGTAQGAQSATEAAINEGAEIIIGPLFAQAVAATGQVARARNIPVIAFSTDASVATRGVYLLSFLPESDVDRVIDYAASRGKRSFAALIPENAYGNVVDAAFRQAVARQGGRVVALERYSAEGGRMDEAVRRIVPALPQADSVFIPGEPDAVGPIAQALATAAANVRRLQFIGTGLWDDQRVFSNATLQGGWFAAPDTRGFKSFSARYNKRYGQEPLRAAALAYDAVSLVAALVKTQGPQRFSEQVLTNPSGFSGVDGVFRFRSDGTNERGLGVMRVTPSGPQSVSSPPRAFPGQT
jgi:ABC-type branched-subunit amino acid transport system substrate-binding protein